MAKRKYASDSGEYGESRHHAQKYNDSKRNDQDSRDGHMVRSTGAQEYAGMPVDMRRGLERPEMIYEDHRAIANLPQEVMIKAYPKSGPYLPEGLDDTGAGVDRQMDYDDAQRRAHFYPKKV
jgi:hypothetical protein